MLAWWTAAGTLPIVATVAERVVGQWLYGFLTRGLNAPSVAFNDAASTVATAIVYTHWVVTPGVAIAFVVMGLRGRRPAAVDGLAVLPFAGMFIGLSVVGFVVLVPRFFTI